jgi:hypothetical protein
MTSRDFDKSISSPESEDGPSQHAWPDGTTLDLFGAPPRHASHSARLAVGSEPAMQGICGRTYIGCATPPGPLSSWENRLRERLAAIGSTESALIWKPSTTPAERSISRLAPSTLHNNGTASTGSHWPTAKASEAGPDFAKEERSSTDLSLQTVMAATWPTVSGTEGGMTSRSGDRKAELLLGGMMRETAEPGLWIAPMERDWKDSPGMAARTRPDGETERVDQLPRQMMAAASLWPVPTAQGHMPPHTPEYIAAKKADGHGMSILQDTMSLTEQNRTFWAVPTVHGNNNRSDASEKAGDGLATQLRETAARWGAPTANPPGGTPEQFIERKRKANENGSRMGLVISDVGLQMAATAVGGQSQTGSSATTGKRAGSPTPAHPCWLMGFPVEFLHGAVLGTQFARRSRRRSSPR